MTPTANPTGSAPQAGAAIGIENIGVQDLDTESFRKSVERVLPVPDPTRRVEALDRVINDIRWFRGFRSTLPHQLSAEAIREHLRRGAACARDLENWTKGAAHLIIRDYVLSAIGDKPLIGEATLPGHEWANLIEFFGRFAEKIEAALQFVGTDRGRPDNAALNDLVWSLGLIWEEFVQVPAFGLTKKRPAPYGRPRPA